jgi:hypothetical protein
MADPTTDWITLTLRRLSGNGEPVRVRRSAILVISSGPFVDLGVKELYVNESLVELEALIGDDDTLSK